jgi:hypothetical protein
VDLQCLVIAAGGIHVAALVDGVDKPLGHRDKAAPEIRVQLEHVEVEELWRW